MGWTASVKRIRVLSNGYLVEGKRCVWRRHALLLSPSVSLPPRAVMHTCHLNFAILQDTSEDDEQGTSDASFGRLLPKLLAQLEALPTDARCTTMSMDRNHAVGRL